MADAIVSTEPPCIAGQSRFGHKKCRDCGMEKALSDFSPCRNGVLGVSAYCRPCAAARSRKRDPQKRQEERRRYYAKKGRGYYPKGVPRPPRPLGYSAIRADRDARAAWRWYIGEGATDEWVAAHYDALGRPWLNPRLSAEERKRLKSIYDRIRYREKKLRRQGRLHWLMSRALKANGTSPTVEKVVGYSITQLRDHIERQFTRGMTWEKFLRGEIHIDHRVPTTAFDLTSESGVRACFALTNLQPLWAKENIRKRDRRDLLL